MYEIHDSPQSVTLRHKTHIAQKLPADVDQKVENFHSFVLKQKKCHEYPLAAIGNMDETPISFDLPPNWTVYFKGQKTITVKTTALLSCFANGTKLLMVVFKRNTMPKEKFAPGILVHVMKKVGWLKNYATHD